MRAGGLLLLVVSLLEQRVPLHSAVFRHPVLSLLCLVAGLAAGAWLPARRAFSVVARRLFEMPRHWFETLLFLFALAAYTAVAVDRFDAIPRLDDGVGALFQARLFARGRVTLPLPPHAGFYEIFGVLGHKANLGHWTGMYPPGWPAVLTPGVWLGVPWLVNPLLGACMAVVVVRLGRALYGEHVARTAGLLVVVSPMVLVVNGTHLSHTPTALFSALTLLCLVRMARTRRWTWGALAGLAWSGAFLCRPLTALVLGTLFALGFLWHERRGLHNAPGIAAGLAFACAGAALLLVFQARTTGDAFTPGHEIGMGSRGKFGFVYLDPVRTHTVELGIAHTLLRLRALNETLLGWPLPLFFLALWPFLAGRSRRHDLLLLAPAPALLALFACYWYYESFIPARYTFAGLPFLLLLAARGLVGLERMCRPQAAMLFPALLAVNMLFYTAVGLPDFLGRFPSTFGDVEPILPRIVRDYGITNAVVFMDATGREPGTGDPFNDYYATGFMRNDLDLQGDVIYARNSRERNRLLVETYPGRNVFLYRYLRCVNKAYLYRVVVEGDGLRYEPVEPRTNDLLPVPAVAEP